MNVLVDKLNEMKEKLASQQWDTTSPRGRCNLIYEVLSMATVDGNGKIDAIDLFTQSHELLLKTNDLEIKSGEWHYSHIQMLDIFDNAIRLAKLQTFA